ncbi:lysosomal acid glucosylceramidase-like [Halictus rubicundus]|uniref:lysosomal acid glucosylceramidase-like n=1 Tax=Halictus rubicundus TaxID=77578 RepID=UPI004036AD99
MLFSDAACKRGCRRRAIGEIMWKSVLFLGFFLLARSSGDRDQSDGCVRKSYGPEKIVCVCNATYCDETPEQDPKVPANGKFYWYVSAKDGRRLSFKEREFGECSNPTLDQVTLNVDSSIQYQQVLGFGGAFTDAAGIHLRNLSEPVQDKLIYSYFGEEGSRYSVGRLPIGGTDFSTRPYTYDDNANDLTLEKFDLAPEDYAYKIPIIQKALKLNPNLSLFSAPWSAPPWMKTNNNINGFGFLKEEYYDLYAEYILKFLEAYRKNGIEVWSVSTGNEPSVIYMPDFKLNSMGWTPTTVANWVANNLGPKLAKSPYNSTKIFLLDDQRIYLPWVIKDILANNKAYEYASGIAVHYYDDQISSPDLVTQTHNAYPDKPIMMTEACLGRFSPHVDMGAWDRGETYMSSILDYLNNWSIGWMDWNLVLDKSGGPNWIKNYVDAPIIVNATKDEYYKQPMYYALKHFSRFIERGSTRIDITDDNLLKSSAFVTPSGETVVVLSNRLDNPRNVTVVDAKKGKLCVELPPRSMNTIIYDN